MDPLSITASAIAIVGLAGNIVSICKEYIESVKDAPADLYKIMIEVGSLKCVFEALELRHDLEAHLDRLRSPEGPIQGCKKALTDLGALLPRASSSATNGKRRRVSTIELAWPFKEKRARKVLESIAMHKATITMMMSSEISNQLSIVKEDIENITAVLTDEQRQSILKWLVTTDPSPNHNRAFELHEPLTSQWLARSPEYLGWLNGSKRFLWLHGIPGAGKTILASYIIERLKTLVKEARDDNVGVVYYYCYFERNQDETSHFLRWIISQLCRQARHIPDAIRTLYDQGTEPSVTSLIDALVLILSMFRNIYVVVDALDESLNRPNLLKLLVKLVKLERNTILHILSLSRKEHDIEAALSGLGSSISLSNPLVDEDIQLYVRSRLRTESNLSRWPDLVLQDVEDSLVKGAKGMFRWAACQIEILNEVDSPSELRGALQTLPKTLDETYERILLKVPEEKLAVVRRILILLTGTQHEEWSPESLSKAAVFDLEDGTCNPEDVAPDPMALLRHCTCLISYSGEELSKVHFAHYTVKEYLMGDRIKLGPASTYAISEFQRTDILARTDMTRFLVSFHENDQFAEDSGYIEYNVWQWYALECQGFDAPHLDRLILRFLDPAEPHFKDWVIMSAPPLPSWVMTPSNWSNITLAYLCYFGFVELAKTFFSGQSSSILNNRLTPEYKRHYYTIKCEGSLPQIAVMCASVPLLQFFLAKGCCSSVYYFDDEPSSLLRMAIEQPWRTQVDDSELSQWECVGEHLEMNGIIKVLLDAGEDPNVSTSRGTLLQMASVCYDQQVVRWLLEAGADVDGTCECKEPSHFGHVTHLAPLNLVGELLSERVDFKRVLRDIGDFEFAPDPSINQHIQRLSANYLVLLEYNAKAFRGA